MVRHVLGLAAGVLVNPAFGQEYAVGAGDTVSIQVFDEPRLSRVALVPSYCRIDIELIGAVDICGRTTAEIAAEVQARLAAGYLANPHIIVAITTYGSQRIEVRGAIKSPGIAVLAGPTPLSQVITTAGGPEGDNVVEVDVILEDGTTSTYTLSKLNLADPPVIVNAGSTVVVRQGRHVYVDGEVKAEGQVPYHEGLTVSQAISLAGGPGAYASTHRVFILKKTGERKMVNLLRVRAGRDSDIVLEPDDRVTLSRSLL